MQKKEHNYSIFISIYTAIGVICGGRIGYVLFYEPTYYFNHPVEIFLLYKGGMSFHGGFLGAVLTIFFIDRKVFFKNGDRLAACAFFIIPIGRLVNFINGELWGTPSTMPWSIIFLGMDTLPRHPVQIYEAIGEGILPALILFTLYLIKLKKILGLLGTIYIIPEFCTCLNKKKSPYYTACGL